MKDRIYLFLEGSADERFFSNLIVPILTEQYHYVQIYRYAARKSKLIKSFIRSIKSMGAEYIFVSDIDNMVCVTQKKQKLLNKITNLDENHIIIVIKEIESWYFAGIDYTNDFVVKLNIPVRHNTDNISKEDFKSLMPKKFDSIIDFQLELVKIFSLEMAIQKNTSFRYFHEKYCTSF